MAAISRAGPARRRGSGDGGMVTVEAAVSLCAFVTVLAMALAGLSLVLDQIRCTDAAREAARLVARGESALAGEAVTRIAPDGSTLAVATSGDQITVDVRGPGAGGLLPGVRVDAEAFAIAEPDTAEPDTAEPGAQDTEPDPGGATDGPSDGLSRPAEGDGR